MRIDKDHWLLNTPVAHRGLWGDGVKENSLEAYDRAAKAGFAIEIDLYGTTDGEIVSFHDDDLFRMTGVKGKIYEKSLSELKSLRLGGGGDKIPTLDEVFEVARGRAPLLIEFKNQPDPSYISVAINKLLGYDGEFAVQAFDPLYLRRIKKQAPRFIRGILATPYSGLKSKFKQYVVKNASLKFLYEPDFISYYCGALPLKKRVQRNLPLLAWTITDKETEIRARKYADNIIFENYIP